MPTIEERLQRLEDEDAIRRLTAQFADAMTRGDHATALSVFAADAVFSIGEPHPFTATGKEAISGLLRQLRDGKDFFVQFVHSGLIELKGETARARWVLHEVATGPGQGDAKKGFYNVFVFAEDELQKAGEDWLITKRHFPYVFVDTDAFPGKAIPLPALTSFPS